MPVGRVRREAAIVESSADSYALWHYSKQGAARCVVSPLATSLTEPSDFSSALFPWAAELPKSRTGTRQAGADGITTSELAAKHKTNAALLCTYRPTITSVFNLFLHQPRPKVGADSRRTMRALSKLVCNGNKSRVFAL